MLCWTYNIFKQRKAKHKNTVNNDKTKGYNFKLYKTIRDNGGWDNWTMVMIEKYPCNDSMEASKRERYYYELLNADLNVYVPSRSINEYQKQYYLKNKDYHTNYYLKNKDKIKNDTKAYRIKNIDTLKTDNKCECGGCYKTYKKAQHLQTKRHLKYLKALNELNELDKRNEVDEIENNEIENKLN